MTRVLVVDDEIDTLNLLRTILEISGYQAFTTLNSMDAIILAEVERPDCILLDIMMPKLDGFTLCKMMRLHPATANLPIVFVTAYSSLDLEDRRKEAGADMVLPKPIGMNALVDAIELATAMRTKGPVADASYDQVGAATPAAGTPTTVISDPSFASIEIKPSEPAVAPAASVAPVAPAEPVKPAEPASTPPAIAPTDAKPPETPKPADATSAPVPAPASPEVKQDQPSETETKRATEPAIPAVPVSPTTDSGSTAPSAPETF